MAAFGLDGRGCFPRRRGCGRNSLSDASGGPPGGLNRLFGRRRPGRCRPDWPLRRLQRSLGRRREGERWRIRSRLPRWRFRALRCDRSFLPRRRCGFDGPGFGGDRHNDRLPAARFLGDRDVPKNRIGRLFDGIQRAARSGADRDEHHGAKKQSNRYGDDKGGGSPGQSRRQGQAPAPPEGRNAKGIGRRGGRRRGNGLQDALPGAGQRRLGVGHFALSNIPQLLRQEQHVVQFGSHLIPRAVRLDLVRGFQHFLKNVLPVEVVCAHWDCCSKIRRRVVMPRNCRALMAPSVLFINLATSEML